MTAINYQSTQRNFPEQQRPTLHRSGSIEMSKTFSGQPTDFTIESPGNYTAKILVVCPTEWAA
jgi:hypothetical protein